MTCKMRRGAGGAGGRPFVHWSIRLAMANIIIGTAAAPCPVSARGYRRRGWLAGRGVRYPAARAEDAARAPPRVTLRGMKDAAEVWERTREVVYANADAAAARARTWNKTGAESEAARLEAGAAEANDRLGALLIANGDGDAYESIKAHAAEEMDTYAVGAAVLARDVRRGRPVDAWPTFWFAMLALNTFPMTPIAVAVMESFIPRSKFVPPQLSTDARLRRVVAHRRKKTTA